MRVLMTADTFGGTWNYAMELCAGLEGMDVEIALATMGRPLSERQRDEVERLDHVRLCESSYRLCWMPDAWDDVARAGEWLLELEARFRPDLVHLNDLGHGDLAWKTPVVMTVHSCVNAWWRAVKRGPAPSEWTRYRRVVADGCRKASLVVAPTRATLCEFTTEHGHPRASAVIPPGRSFPARERMSVQDWREKGPLFFAAGRLWDEGKNLRLLAEVAPSLRWPVAVAGEQRALDGEPCSVTGVRTLGHLDPAELAKWFRRASVYVSPTRYEPVGLSILEAARAGCALVLGDVPSLRETWDGAARFVPTDDREGLLRALNELSCRAELRRGLAKRAWKRAERYTPERMAEAYGRCYRRWGRARMNGNGRARLCPSMDRLAVPR